MFRDMRRKKQLLPEEESMEILKSATAGVLGVTGDDDYPYTVPISYSVEGDRIFIHSAVEGHKIDGIKKNDKVSLAVIDQDEIVQETFTTHYKSVVAFGRARILTDDGEKRFALESLIKKYSPDFVEEGEEYIKKDWDRVAIIEVKIEHMTGKAAIEIIKER